MIFQDCFLLFQTFELPQLFFKTQLPKEKIILRVISEIIMDIQMFALHKFCPEGRNRVRRLAWQ